MRSRRLVAVGVVVVLAAVALLSWPPSGSDAANEVVVYCSIDQVHAAPVLRDVERRTGLVVRAVYDTEETKSTGVLNRLIAEGDRPQADVFWSGDHVRPLVLARRGLIEAYAPSSAADVPAVYRAADGTWTGGAARVRVLLVNTERLGDRPAPVSVRDLADPRFRGDATLASPLFGTTTTHVAALFAAWGEAEGKAFLDALKANEVRIAASNGEVKRLVVAGTVAVGLTDVDDALDAVRSGAPVRVVVPDQGPGGVGVVVLPTSVVLLRGRPHDAAGRRLVDALCSIEVERALCASGAYVPLRDAAAGADTLPGLRSLGEVRPFAVDPAKVASEVERLAPWLRTWVGL